MNIRETTIEKSRARRLSTLADAIEQKAAQGASITEEIARLRKMARSISLAKASVPPCKFR